MSTNTASENGEGAWLSYCLSEDRSAQHGRNAVVGLRSIGAPAPREPRRQRDVRRALSFGVELSLLEFIRLKIVGRQRNTHTRVRHTTSQR